MEYIKNMSKDVGKRTMTPEEKELLVTLLIEKDKGKKPIRGKDGSLACPMCETTLPIKFNFCPYCGQRIKWNTS